MSEKDELVSEYGEIQKKCRQIEKQMVAEQNVDKYIDELNDLIERQIQIIDRLNELI